MAFAKGGRINRKGFGNGAYLWINVIPIPNAQHQHSGLQRARQCAAGQYDEQEFRYRAVCNVACELRSDVSRCGPFESV